LIRISQAGRQQILLNQGAGLTVYSVNSGEVEKWRSGEVEKWRSGEVEKWRSGEGPEVSGLPTEAYA
jgi:hypothetical protein